MKIRLKPVLRLVFSLIAVGGLNTADAQNFYLPVNELSLMRMEREGLHRQGNVHFGLKPISNNNLDLTGIDGVGRDTTKYYYWYTEKLFSDHLIELRKKNFKLNADFIFDFGYGNEIQAPGEPTDTYVNQRGFSISAQIGERVFLFTDFREIQTRVPAYLNRFADSLSVLPGSPQLKIFKETGYDYNMANGYIGVRAADWLELSMGHYEQFIGFGHRSLILSDNSFNYPFASYSLKPGKGKIQYKYTIGLLQNQERLPVGEAPESLFKRKYFNVNYISFKPFDNLEIGLAEVTIWKSFDDSTGTVPFNAQSLIPIPGLNTAINGFGSEDQNSLLGLNVGWHPTENLSLYGQFVADDPDDELYGYQLGAEYRNILDRFDINIEYNHADPYMYGAEESLQSFSHSNQALTHPMGAGFDEYRLGLTYFYKRILLSAEWVYAEYDETGRDILKPRSTENISSSRDLNYQNIRFAYVFNPKTNFQVYAGFTNREEDFKNDSNTNQFWYFGIRTDLNNIYRDF